MFTKISAAAASDIDSVAALYDEVNDFLALGVNYPGWKRGVYPTRQDAEEAAHEGCLYAAFRDGALAGSAILRGRQEEAYRGVSWPVEADDEQVLVICTLCVSPRFRRLGVGEAMLGFAARIGRSRGMRALRLDVYDGNLPAVSMYEKSGFVYVDTVSLGLEAYGLDSFKLYEKPL